MDTIMERIKISASEWFDRWGNKEAYEMLAHIFKTLPLIGSEEDAQYYEDLPAECDNYHDRH